MAGEREMAEVVGAELHLEAVVRMTQWQEHHAGVVAEDIDAPMAFGHIGREARDRREIGEVERVDFDAGIGMEPANRIGRLRRGPRRGSPSRPSRLSRPAFPPVASRVRCWRRSRPRPCRLAPGRGARSCMHVCLHQRGGHANH